MHSSCWAMGLSEEAAPHGSPQGSPCGMGWEVVVLSVGSALHHLLQSRLCTLKPCQVSRLSESSAVNAGNPIQLGLVKFSPEVHSGITNVFTGFKLPVQ